MYNLQSFLDALVEEGRPKAYEHIVSSLSALLYKLKWHASSAVHEGEQHQPDQDDHDDDNDADNTHGVNLRLKLFRKDELMHYVREPGYTGSKPPSFRVVNHWDDPHPSERRRASDMRRARQKAGLVVEDE